MAAVVIDASMSSAWCFPGEETEYAKAVFQAVSSSSVDGVAPPLWACEARNSILMALRRGRIKAAAVEPLLASLFALDVRLIEQPSDDGVFSSARRPGLTVYDAAYLDVALQERLPVASLDRQLVRAAETVGVPRFQP